MDTPPFDFDQKWKELENGLSLIFDACLNTAAKGTTKRSISPKEWTNYYTIVYNWCTRQEEQKKEELYHKVSSFFESIVRQQAELLKTNRGVILLREYLKIFDNFTAAATFLKNIFQYMHRYWIPHQQQNAVDGKSIKIIDQLALVKWREICYEMLKNAILEALLDLVEQDREGETVDKSLLSNFVQAYIKIGVHEEIPDNFYKQEFQNPFIEKTKEYYTKESDLFHQTNSVSEYMKKAEERLAHEQQTAQRYLHPSTEPELKSACEAVLITRHNEILQNEFQSMLKHEREDDMKRFYHLLSRIPNGLDLSSETMKNFLIDVGMAIIKEQSSTSNTKRALINSAPFIHRLIKLHKKYVDIITKCFSDHKLFVQAMDEAFTIFINKNVGVFTMAELLNFFVDHLLKGNEKLSEEQLEETLESTVRLFSYFDDKDVFYLAFRRSLSKRLLSRKINEDAEMSFIAKLKVRCGDVYTKKLEGMFNDIKLSNERQPAFKEYVKTIEPPLGIDITVTVLNDLYWPLTKQTELALSSELLRCMKAFEDFYHKHNEKRKLTWLYNQGNVTMAYNYPDPKGRSKKLDLIISCMQACIVMLFNDTNRLSFKDVQDQLNLTDEILKYSIAPLIYHKLKLLNRIVTNANNVENVQNKKENPNKETNKPKEDDDDDKDTVTQDDEFEIAQMKRIPKTRVAYPPGSTRMIQKQSQQLQDKTKQERIIKIELALVRVMKARNVCTLNELISEASSQLMKYFRPDPRIVKKRIETLMERGFMKRDEEDQKQIHYVA
eukprot:TRINITY_DN1271_c0_g1_i1.p1 TRINITY_DN1271_c0_g1~~TRINITY_DN1271_c0_g1_i1.p1  ORF type:complete len:780 (-),score=173.34 TRINITY_DN1271_c0_g1_i1:16-2355(-)